MTSLSSFAPYAPPPDEAILNGRASSSSKPQRPWFPNYNSSQSDMSYQSGGIPTFGGASSTGGLDLVAENESEPNQWETRYGSRVDMLAALAYVLGPLSAFCLLAIETKNDYVRFHAYQSALLSTPLVILRIFLSIILFPQWIRSLCTLGILVAMLLMAFRAYIDADRNGLVHYYLPYIGPLAEKWLSEE